MSLSPVFDGPPLRDSAGRKRTMERVNNFQKAGSRKQPAQSVGGEFNYSKTRSVRLLELDGRCKVFGLLNARLA